MSGLMVIHKQFNMSINNQTVKQEISPNGEPILDNNDIIYKTAREFMFHCNGLTVYQIEAATKMTIDYFKSEYPIKFPLERPKDEFLKVKEDGTFYTESC